MTDYIALAHELVRKQAEDDGLWFVAQTATEAYLMAALRDLHAVVEAVPDVQVSSDTRAMALTSAPSAEAEPDEDECPHGNAYIVRDCLRCGAPVCCNRCCAEDWRARQAAKDAIPSAQAPQYDDTVPPIWETVSAIGREGMAGAQADGTARWKSGNEYLPFHPKASHVRPDYRDGWNDCYEAGRSAARNAVPAGVIAWARPYGPDEGYCIAGPQLALASQGPADRFVAAGWTPLVAGAPAAQRAHRIGIAPSAQGETE